MDELTSATDLAATHPTRHPHESEAYREARQNLLDEEMGLRRHAERVAELRRQLPPGGEVLADYSFVGEDGADVKLSQLFGDHDTLVMYSYMFGWERDAPRPMCTSLMSGFDQKIADIGRRVAIAFTARSPIERQIEANVYAGGRSCRCTAVAAATTRGRTCPADDADMAGYNVFTRRDGAIRHFWGDEISVDMADPDQDPRGAVGMDPALFAARHRSGGPQHGLAPEPDVRIELISLG